MFKFETVTIYKKSWEQDIFVLIYIMLEFLQQLHWKNTLLHVLQGSIELSAILLVYI